MNRWVHTSGVKPGFQIVVPVVTIVSVAATGTIIWKRSSNHPGRSRDDPCDRNDRSSEIDSSSILATETTGKDSQAIAYF